MTEVNGLKIHKDGGFDIEIVDVCKENGTLRVKTRTPFGEDNLGLGLHAEYIDAQTGLPRWRKEVKQLLEQKYGRLVGDSAPQTSEVAQLGIIKSDDLDKPDKKPLKKK